MKRLILGLLIWGLLGDISVAFAIAIKKVPKPLADRLIPHQAIYEITLASKKSAVSISDVKGRMVFEITGSPCEGYTQKMRMITRVTDESGKPTLTDVRSSTWENASGRRFRFNSSQYFDQILQEVVSGAAIRKRKKTTITVQVKKPAPVDLELPGDVLFPTQHSLAILRAAKIGQKHLDTRIYDGSEQGQGFYQTFSYIGEKILPEMQQGKAQNKDRKKLLDLGLASMPSWPVAISYFNGKGNSDDALPAYELSYRLYQNGVSRNLLINYGDFSVYGSLDRVKYLRSATCNRRKRKK